MQPAKTIYIDPSSTAYYKNKLFDINDSHLNRDDTLMPFVRLREALHKQGHSIETADYLFESANKNKCDYYSFGVLSNYKQLQNNPSITLKAFVIFEPPVVQPELYQALPELTSMFELVYVHNTHGDGYSLKGVNAEKLRKFHWPQPRKEVIESIWSTQPRSQRIVVINGHHVPRKVPNELYSKRIEVMASLAKYGVVDLYGRGWDRWWSRASMWLPYWKHRKALMSIYHGACESKYPVLGLYDYSLCFENMAMKGYVTEKIFDCIYAGTIPIYLGASDIADLIPEDVYIDFRTFNSISDLVNNIRAMTENEKNQKREAGRFFLESNKFINNYYNSPLSVFG